MMSEREPKSIGAQGARAPCWRQEAGESLASPVSAGVGPRQRDRARFLAAFRELTGLTAGSASPEALPRIFLDRPVPSPRDLLGRYASVLEVRTTNVLRRHVAGIVEEGAWTYRRLLEIRGFGVFCLINILKVLAES